MTHDVKVTNGATCHASVTAQMTRGICMLKVHVFFMTAKRYDWNSVKYDDAYNIYAFFCVVQARDVI